MSSRIIPREELTAFQRWELGALAEANVWTGEAAVERPDPGAVRAAYEEGRRAGLAAGRETLRQDAQRLAQMAEGVERALRDFAEELAGPVVDLAFVIARQLVQRELEAQPQAIVPIVRDAIAALAHTVQGARLLLNPADVPAVRDGMGEDLSRLQWRIVEDERIAQGGCRISMPSGELDATLEARWSAVAAAIGREHAAG
jgi:flagellar assembly protein FliH